MTGELYIQGLSRHFHWYENYTQFSHTSFFLQFSFCFSFPQGYAGLMLPNMCYLRQGRLCQWCVQGAQDSKKD